MKTEDYLIVFSIGVFILFMIGEIGSQSGIPHAPKNDPTQIVSSIINALPPTDKNYSLWYTWVVYTVGFTPNLTSMTCIRNYSISSRWLDNSTTLGFNYLNKTVVCK